MTDQLPDFEPTVPPVVDYPKPKKPRRKPAKKLGRAKQPYMQPPKRVVKKAVKRRGRPPGALGKSKAANPLASRNSFVAQFAAAKIIMDTLTPLSIEDRAVVLEAAKGMLK